MGAISEENDGSIRDGKSVLKKCKHEAVAIFILMYSTVCYISYSCGGLMYLIYLVIILIVLLVLFILFYNTECVKD